jgi:crotonobetaine/carnitine-CoA ligase
METIGTFIRGKAEEHGEKELLLAVGAETSYAGLDRRTDAVAAGLRSLGLEVGDTACLMMRNSLANVTAWLGMAKAGIVEVPLNTALKGLSLAYQVDQSDSQAIVLDPEFLPRLSRIAAELPKLRHVLVDGPLDELDLGDLPPRIEVRSLDDFDPDASFSPFDLRASAPSAILYTSGTTGPSKGVVVTHNYNLELSRNVCDLMHYGPSDALYSAFPLFHANAKFATLLAAMHAGARVVLDDRFTASGLWNICREREITAFNYMGALLLMLWKQPEREDDRNHPVERCFGAPCPPDLWEPFEQRFGVRLVDVYGSTEVGLGTANTLEDRRIGSAGRVAPGYEIAILDEADRRLPPGVPGEIAFRADHPDAMIREYYRKPEETIAAFRNFWFHTGDRGVLDEDGYMTFVDRMKDAIRRRGENVSSWEVEQVLTNHGAVLEAAAYGLESDLHEEEVAVAIVLRPGMQLTPAALLDYCQEQMAHFAVPRYVRFLEVLPKNQQQKVQKFILREEGVTEDCWDRQAAGYEVRRQ